MTDAADDLALLGAAVDWTDADAVAQARAARLPGLGQIAEIVEWLAGCQSHYPPRRPKRARCVTLGTLPDPAWTIAAELAVGVRTLTLPNAATDVDLADVDLAGVDPADVGPADGDPIAAALAAGAAAADEEVEAGADLLIVADPRRSDTAAVLVTLLADVEPVALLPRGADAIDTADWIARAERLRDARRHAAAGPTDAGSLLVALADPSLAAAAGLVLRAVARRTPVVLDGTAAVAAALLCHEVQARAGRWWRLAATSPDPVHTRAAQELGQRPLLDLGIATGDGTAGLLTVPLLATAALFAEAS